MASSDLVISSILGPTPLAYAPRPLARPLVGTPPQTLVKIRMPVTESVCTVVGILGEVVKAAQQLTGDHGAAIVAARLLIGDLGDGTPAAQQR